MRLISEASQILFVLVASSMVAIWMGVSYAVVATLTMAASLTLLLDNARVSKVPVKPIEVFQMTGTSVLFGLIWPTLPVILIVKRGGADGDAS